MNRTFLPVASAALLAASAALAEEMPVVVELFTSQGCSSCPPADAILRDLAGMPGVLPLALHVDYWDYIGWADSFADPAFTARQQRYALAAGERTVYTPQFVIGGLHSVVGADAMEVMEQVARLSRAPAVLHLTVSQAAGSVTLRAERLGPAEPIMVQLVRYRPEATVEIGGGENAGHRLTYVNIVNDWQMIGRWDGPEPLDMTLPWAAGEPGVVLLQAEGPGAILAAARLGGDE